MAWWNRLTRIERMAALNAAGDERAGAGLDVLEAEADSVKRSPRLLDDEGPAAEGRAAGRERVGIGAALT